MSRSLINKKKYNNIFLFKIITIFCILFLTFLILFKLLNNNNYYKYLEYTINSISKDYNYIFNELEINGINNISPEEIENYFNQYYHSSIFLVPFKKISKNLEDNNWIKLFSLNTNYKNKISILIEESKPIGVYYNGKNYFLIDEFGEIIDVIKENKILPYIQFTGKNAQEYIPRFIMEIPNSMKSIIQKAEYIGKRRWNIILKNNIIIKLPEFQEKEALKVFNEIYDNISVQDESEIDIIDLRIPKRAIIKFNE